MSVLLEKLNRNKRIPMHMPGHKRNVENYPFMRELKGDIDVTETESFDNLAHPQGILKDAMEKAAEIWGADRSYFLVNGSTCGILAGFKTLSKENDTVLMSRLSHKSAYNAIALLGLKTRFLKGEIYNSSGRYSSIDPKEVESVLAEDKSVKFVFITSPLYTGEIQKVKEIADICHRFNIPLMVDEAHGSHLGFTDYFSGGSVKAGGDIVVQSLHKTLLGLTQTAILHVNGSRVDLQKLQKNINVFQTSSPSYILMASICECVDFVYKNTKAFENWQNILQKFYLQTECLQHLFVTKGEKRDKSKILIDCGKANINGTQLMNILREEYNIELEMAYGNCALAMTGIGDTKENLSALANALKYIDKRLENAEKKEYTLSTENTNLQFSIKQAVEKESKKTEEKQAVGKISGEYMWIYPPGVPIIIPGEVITQQAVETAKLLQKNGSEIMTDSGFYPHYLIVD